MANPSDMFLFSMIDVPLWNKAGWSATLYLTSSEPADLPIIGLVFKDREAGRKIFEGWRQFFGDADRDDLLRISIIEGALAGESEFGYSVHVTTDLERVDARIRSAGGDPDKLMLVSRVNRMYPAAGSAHLPDFKHAVATHGGRYYIAPVSSRGGIEKLSDLEPHLDLKLLKAKIDFRRIEDVVNPNDQDFPALRKPK